MLGPATLSASPPGIAANEDRVVYLMRGVMGPKGGKSLSESSIGEGELYLALFFPTRLCQLLSSSLGMGARVPERTLALD